MIQFEPCNDWDWASDYAGKGFGDEEGNFEFYPCDFVGDSEFYVVCSFAPDGFSEYPLDVVVV